MEAGYWRFPFGMSGDNQNTEPPPAHSPLLSFFTFWWRCSKSAASNSWGHYDHLTNVATIIQFVSVLGFAAIWITKHFKGIDMNFWFLALPVGVAVISFLVQFVRAPVDIYRETVEAGKCSQQVLKTEIEGCGLNWRRHLQN